MPQSTGRKHIVIVGGGFGGINAAKELKKADLDITIIDQTNHHLFQPLLYQVATAALSPGDIAVPIRSIIRKKPGVKVIQGTVVDINEDENYLYLKDGDRINFDYLILAPGARYNYFGNDEWEENAPGLKSIRNALDIRETILLSLERADRIEDPKLREPYLTYVVIGGGPTGVEMAGAIAEIAKHSMMADYDNFSPNETRIFLVEAGPKILNGYPDSLSERARKKLEDMGVSVLLNTPVTDISRHQVTFKEGTIETPNIIWAAGVAASPLLERLDVKRDKSGRVFVNQDLSLPKQPNIFVIGDAAHLEDENGTPLPAVAPVAIQQGRFLGKQLKGEIFKGANRRAFNYVDKGNMATIGRAKAIADIRGFKFTGFFAWVLWSVVHIFFLIGFRNRFRVFVEWMWHYITFNRGVRLITDRAEQQTELHPKKEDVDQMSLQDQ